MFMHCLRCNLFLDGSSDATTAKWISSDSTNMEHVSIFMYLNDGIEEADLCSECFNYFRNRPDFTSKLIMAHLSNNIDSIQGV